MATRGKGVVSKRLVLAEIAAFLGVIALLWLDELVDIPYHFLGAQATPVNWRESLLETLLIVPVCLATVYYTRRLVNRLKSLEGFLPICASCKKIRDDEGNWQQMESYIRNRSEAEFSHGICPECAARLYPELFPGKGGGPGRAQAGGK